MGFGNGMNNLSKTQQLKNTEILETSKENVVVVMNVIG